MPGPNRTFLSENDPEGYADINGMNDFYNQGEWAPVLKYLGQGNENAQTVLGQYAQGNLKYGQTVYNAFSGYNEAFPLIIENDIFTLKSWHFLAFPPIKTTKLGTRSMTKIQFGVSPFDPAGPQQLGRHFTWTENTKQFHMGDNILSVVFNREWLEYGPGAGDIFRASMIQMASNAIFTLGMAAVAELMSWKSVYAVFNTLNNTQTFADLAAMLEKKRYLTLIGNKEEMAAQLLLNAVDEVREETGGAPPKYAVFAPGTRNQFAFSAPRNTEVSRSGSLAEAIQYLGPQVFSTIGNVICIEEKATPVHALGRTKWNPLVTTYTTGWWFAIGPDHIWTVDTTKEYNTSAMMSPKLLDLTGDGSDRLCDIDKVIVADQYMDPSTGELRRDLLAEIIKTAKTSASQYGFTIPKTQWGDDILDMHIYHDSKKVPHIITFLGQTDKHFVRTGFWAQSAKVNAAKAIRESGGKLVGDLMGLLEWVRDVRSVPMPLSKYEPSAFEALAVATGSYYTNSGAGDGTRFAVGMTPGNSYGSDNLPPLYRDADGEFYIGTVLERPGPLEVRPVTRPSVALADETNTSVSSSSLSEPRTVPIEVSAPVISGRGREVIAPMRFITQGGSETDQSAPLAYTATAIAGAEPVLAPTVPYGFSTAPALYYLAAAYEANSPNVRTWVKDRPETAKKFERLVAGIRAFDLIADSIDSTFGGVPGSEHTKNLFMRPDTLPAHIRPTGEATPRYLSRLALLQDGLLGLALPTGVANLSATTGTSAQGPLVAAFRTEFGNRYNGERQSEIDPAGSSQFNTTAHVDNIRRTLIPYFAERQAVGFANLLAVQSQLDPSLKEELLTHAGKNFLKALNDHVARGGSVSNMAFVDGDANLNNFERLVTTPHAQLGRDGTPVAAWTLACGTDASGHIVAARFLNQIWNLVVRNHANVVLSAEYVATAAARARTPKGATRLATEIETFSQRQIPNNNRPSTTYRFVRLSVDSTFYQNGGAERAYAGITRCANPFDATHAVVAPYSAGTNNGNGAAYANMERFIKQGVQDLRKTARSEIRVPTKLGPSAMYMSRDIGTVSAAAAKSAGPPQKITTAARDAQNARAAGGASFPPTRGGGNRNDTDPAARDLPGMVNKQTHPHPYGNMEDLPLSSGMLAYTEHSPWLVDAIHELEYIVNPVERLFAAAMIGTVPTTHFYKQAVKNSMVVPRQYVVINAYVQLKVTSSIWLNDNVGVTEYTMPSSRVSWDAKMDVLEIISTFKAGTYLIEEKNVTNIPAVFAKGYEGGGGSEFIRSGSFKDGFKNSGTLNGQYDADYRNPTKSKDRMVFAYGISGVELPNPFSLSGTVNLTAYRCRLARDNARDLQTPFALALNLMTKYFMTPTGQFVNDNPNSNAFDASFGGIKKLIPNTFMIWQQRTCNFNQTQGNYSNVTEGTGPLAMIQPYRAGVLAGQPGLFTSLRSTQAITVNQP